MVPNAICTKMFLTLLAFISLYSVDCEAVSEHSSGKYLVTGEALNCLLSTAAIASGTLIFIVTTPHPPPRSKTLAPSTALLL